MTVASLHKGGELRNELDRAGIPVVCLHKRGRWDAARMLWRLHKAIVAVRPQIVHAYQLAPNVAVAVLRPFIGRTRVVWGVRNSAARTADGGFRARAMCRLGAVLSRFAHLIICNSEAGRAVYAAEGYCAQRMVVVPNGIDTKRYKPDSDARRDVRAEWGVATAHRLVGHVARFDPSKDHVTFLHAASLVAKRLPDVRFVCVGGGPEPYARQLAECAQSLGLEGKLIWAGIRQDMPRVYNALDLTVSSSSTEGLANAIAEAMATGLSCVATDVGDSAALIGGLGTICPPSDSRSLAQEIVAALSPAVAPVRIRQRICDHYSSSLLLERTETHLLATLRYRKSRAPALLVARSGAEAQTAHDSRMERQSGANYDPRCRKSTGTPK